MPKSQSQKSKEAYVCSVTVLLAVGANPDPSVDVVQFQFVPGGLPPRQSPTTTEATGTPPAGPDVWVTGRWLRTTGLLYAAVTVGPGGSVALGLGDYAVAVRIRDSPTVPVKWSDTIRITF